MHPSTHTHTHTHLSPSRLEHDRLVCFLDPLAIREAGQQAAVTAQHLQALNQQARVDLVHLRVHSKGGRQLVGQAVRGAHSQWGRQLGEVGQAVNSGSEC